MIRLGRQRDYWLAAERTTADGLPAGRGEGPRLHKEHMVQYWLRLPLPRRCGVGMVWLDYFMSATDRLDEDVAAIA